MVGLHWTKYIKGMARGCTALALADQLMISQMDLPELCPLLYQSLRKIEAKIGALDKDPLFIAFENAKLSEAGAIRKAYTVLQWLGVLIKLKKQSTASASAILARWNTESSQRSQIVGNRRAALLNLLECAPPKALEILLRHFAKHGEKICFYEEAFALKLLMPGTQPLFIGWGHY